MTTLKHPGVEISVNHYDFITLYRACKVPKEGEKSEQNDTADKIDELCRAFSTGMSNYSPCIGEIVGVYLPNDGPNGKWVRGRVEECIQIATGWQYRVLLIDRGYYVRSQRRHLTLLNKRLKTNPPPLAKRVGLYGVLPNARLDQNTKLLLTDFFHKGQIYFKKKLKILNILFGDISVQDRNGNIYSLTKHLVAKNLVKEVGNFETEAENFYRGVKEVDKSFDASASLPTYTEEKGDEHISYSSMKKGHVRSVEKSKDTEAENFYRDVKEVDKSFDASASLPTYTEEKRDEPISHSSMKKGHVHPVEKSKDTGYSSTDSDGPFVREDTIFVPAGFNYESSQTNKKKNLKSKEVRPIKTYYQLKQEREKSRKIRSSKRAEENTKPNSREESNNTCRDTSHGRMKDQECKLGKYQETIGTQEMDDLDDYERRKFGFYEMKPQKAEVKGCEKKCKAFNLNYKTNMENPEKESFCGDAKKEIKDCNNESDIKTNQKTEESKCEVSNNSNVVEFREEKREISEISHDSLKSSDNSSLNISNLAASSSGINDSKVSDESNLSTSSLNSTLTKRQRVSNKLKAGLKVREIINRYSEGNVIEEQNTSNINQSNDKDCNDGSNIKTNQKTEESKCEVSNNSNVVEFREEKREISEISHDSLKSSDNSSLNISNLAASSSGINDSKVFNESNLSTSSLNSSLTKKQRVSNKLKAALKVREIINRYSGGNVIEEQNTSNINQSNDDNHSSICHTGEGFKITSKSPVTETNEKCEQVNQTHGLHSDTVECHSAARPAQQGCKETITESTHVSTKVTESSKGSNTLWIDHNESSDPGISMWLSLQQKRKRVQEKLRKRKEKDQISDSDVGKAGVSTSCSQSVCSEDSNSSLPKPSERTTLASITTEPIVELEKQEDNFDYVDDFPMQTFLRGIIQNTGVLIHTKNNKIIRPAMSLTECYLDGNIIQV